MGLVGIAPTIRFGMVLGVSVNLISSGLVGFVEPVILGLLITVSIVSVMWDSTETVINAHLAITPAPSVQVPKPPNASPA